MKKFIIFVSLFAYFKEKADMILHSLIDKLKVFFSTQPVEKAWIFGSFARGEENENSDLDILVSYSPGTRLGIFGILQLTEKLENIVGRKVDLVEQGTLYNRVQKEVNSQKIMVYERDRIPS